jgi:hypothetical protein
MGTMTAKSASRSVVDRVARTAASASALPVSVPPTPLVSMLLSSSSASMRAAMASVHP